MKTKDDIQNILSVSPATVSNWIKTGLIPDHTAEGYSDSDFEKLIDTIHQNGKLRSRANRFHSQNLSHEINLVKQHENVIILKQLLKIIKTKHHCISTAMLAVSLKYLEDNQLIRVNLNTYDSFKIIYNEQGASFSKFIDDWFDLTDKPTVYEFCKELKKIEFPKNETDFLGAIYESLRNTGEKSKFGAYFTPSCLVEDINISKESSVLDPCGGTGTILLSILDKNHPPNKITIRDIDALALRIARINFAVFFRSLENFVNIELLDALEWQDSKEFDLIITNPPWGALSKVDNDLEKEKKSDSKLSNSFAIIVNQALKKSSESSKMIFILPESFLFVDAYSTLRKFIFESSTEKEIIHFGNAFKGVLSKVIRLQIDFSKKNNTEVKLNHEKVVLPLSLLKINNYRPPLLNNSDELNCLIGIFKRPFFTLKGRCKFGLGIVTGNNKVHLSNAEGMKSEAIFTGKELKPFVFRKNSNYIRFIPSELQQTVKENLYRSDKICYKFISNKFVMAADFDSRLILNSINFFIPDNNFSIKGLVAFFNAPIVSFIFQKLFGSIKVLRNHIENFPIPNSYFLYEKSLEGIYDKAVEGLEYKDELERLCLKIYGLN